MSVDIITRANEIRARITDEADILVDTDPIALRDLAYEASDALTDLVAFLTIERHV